MNTILFYLLTALLPFKQTKANTVIRTYKFEHTTTRNELLTDYIQLVFKDTIIVKGIYYGNDYNYRHNSNYHFVADIKFNDVDCNGLHYLSLYNYQFSKEKTTPFKKAKYYELKEIPDETKHGINFFGTITKTKLDLRRTLFWHDSRVDIMPFELVNE